MNKHLIASTFIASFLSLSASAEVTINTGTGIQVLAHNGQEVSTTQLQTHNGTHQLLVRYQVDLSRKKDNAQLENSDTWVLLFDADDQTLQLSTPPVRNSNQFRQFNRNGNWQLKAADNKPVSFEKSPLKKEGFQFARNYEQELAKFNNTDHPAAFISHTEHKEPIKKHANFTQNNMPETGQPATAISTEQMLHYWYNAADKNTQIRFKNWLKSQH